MIQQTIITGDARPIKQPPYRVAPNAGTHESPFYLLYGREPRLPLDASMLLSDSNASTSVSEPHARLVTNLEESRNLTASNT